MHFSHSFWLNFIWFAFLIVGQIRYNVEQTLFERRIVLELLKQFQIICNDRKDNILQALSPSVRTSCSLEFFVAFWQFLSLETISGIVKIWRCTLLTSFHLMLPNVSLGFMHFPAIRTIYPASTSFPVKYLITSIQNAW